MRTWILAAELLAASWAVQPATSAPPEELFAGFDLDLALPLDLREFERVEDDLIEFDESVSVRKVSFRGDGGAEVALELFIGQSDARAARAKLDATLLERGLPACADLDGTSGFGSKSDAHAAVGRLNVALLVTGSGDLDRIAGDLRDSLAVQPTFEGPRFEAFRPAIRAFSLAGEGDRVPANGLKAMIFEIEDAESTREEMTYRFPAGENHVVVYLNGRFAVAGSDPGKDRVQVYVANRRQLVSSASFEILIVE